jgi:hypothetical protein
MIKFALKALIACVALAAPGLFAQNLLLNGDFQTGNLNYWTLFATPNGNLGPGLPNVMPFDTAGTGTATDAAQFQVGETEYNQATGHTSQGGGFYQAFNCTAGQYIISGDVAALCINGLGNADAGTFSILIDGNSVTGIGLGGIANNQTLRGTLDTTVSLGGGLHIFQLEITRPWLNGGSYGGTPLEYVDDLSVIPVPEPRGLLPLGVAALLLAGLRRKMGKTSAS